MHYLEFDKVETSDKDRERILLTGDAGKAFRPGESLDRLPCEVCPNILDAIDTAAKGRFDTIAVVMGGVSTRLASALKALRRVSEARIVLLVEMHEEPAAIRLIGASSNGSALADDYLICPVRPDELCRTVVAAKPVRQIEEARLTAPDKETQKRIELLEKLATEDDLTGLKNRRYIRAFAKQVMARAERENGRVTLLIFDIDNFKSYNDSYGHVVGDKILVQAGTLMQRSCRSHDVVGRIGGDEFAVIFWDDPKGKARSSDGERRSTRADHPKEAIVIARRFIRELEKAELPLLGPEGKGVLTISGALASYPRDGSTLQELFFKADQAMLDAKRSGKNRIYLVGKPQNDIAHGD